MSYEEWLKSTEFGLRRRYKVDNIAVDKGGMRVDFINNFHLAINTYALKGLWESNEVNGDGFSELCKDIEREFMKQIMNF